MLACELAGIPSSLRPLGPAPELWKGLKVIRSVVTGRAMSHPFSATAALGWFLGIPAP